MSISYRSSSKWFKLSFCLIKSLIVFFLSWVWYNRSAGLHTMLIMESIFFCCFVFFFFWIERNEKLWNLNFLWFFCFVSHWKPFFTALSNLLIVIWNNPQKYEKLKKPLWENWIFMKYLVAVNCLRVWIVRIMI